MNLLDPKKLAFLIAPLASALIFYGLVVLGLKSGDYLPGIRIYFLIFAIPFSYLGVFAFGFPSLILLKRFDLLNYFSLAIAGSINGLLTILVPVTIVLIAQKANLREVYLDMLEPFLAASIAGLVGILIFKAISDKGIIK